MNYYSKLWRNTSNAFPHLVPDRYQEMLRVSQIWRLLKLMKWQGCHEGSPDPGPGGLVLFCPACPQPGVNISSDEEVNLADWKFSRSIVMDGNFKAEHMKPKNPDEELWLMDGRGYMVTSGMYKQYLANSPNPIERSDCSNHWAVNQANVQRNQLAATSIGGCACVRHRCFIPHSMVDFQKGEQQVNMDYALVHAVQHGMNLRQHVITFYDINCQYSKNLARRLKGNNFVSLPDGLQIQPGISLWHVHGHKAECFSRYAPNFIPGAGRVDGKIMETLWSSLNVVSPLAQGMATPHRQELLDFQMNDSNFLKMVQMPLVLRKKLRAAQKGLASVKESFMELDNGVPLELRQKWVEEEIMALANQILDPKAMDIFEVQLKKAPTSKSVEIDLISWQGEYGCPHGLVTWLAKALKLEEAQLVFALDSQRAESTMMKTYKLSMIRRREQLQSHINGLMECAEKYSGGSLDDVLQNASQVPDQPDNWYDTDNPFLIPSSEGVEFVVLPLPSYLGKHHFQRFGVGGIVEQELQLQQGQANDTLHELWLALADKAVIFRTKVRHATNYNHNTRAWGKVASTEAIVQRHAGIYRRCRKQMIALGAGPDVLSRYQELHDTELRVSTAIADPNARGHQDDTLAWFWTMDVPRDTAIDNWMSECL
ncbi:hypothetical protein SCLCIDRAFT_116995 [Scleroderma citrinum Foug A]|uniref:CxC2-like cysteine cluster KDZ transposase-associated domain-containing protein n=1 Tax=Scleroderma citrinum Foug A TaxID=1036808 RepID=A0A0C3AF43_9AGAM|nr:hypothetical protein SCLCIDRAFT_116995 [Scleroderma citrinum Foug A]